MISCILKWKTWSGICRDNTVKKNLSNSDVDNGVAEPNIVGVGKFQPPRHFLFPVRPDWIPTWLFTVQIDGIY